MQPPMGGGGCDWQSGKGSARNIPGVVTAKYFQCLLRTKSFTRQRVHTNETSVVSKSGSDHEQ